MLHSSDKKVKKKNFWKPFLIGLALFVIIGYGIYFYLISFAEARDGAKEAMNSTQEVKVETASHAYIFQPLETEAQTGLIFFPENRVEAKAYGPLMQSLAQNGILCILINPTCAVAALDSFQAGQWQEAYPEIESWYLAGHGQGGNQAASYLRKEEEEGEAFDGIFTLGTRLKVDLSSYDGMVFCVYGSQENFTEENLQELQENAGQGACLYELDGACHQYYGDYQEDEELDYSLLQEQQESLVDLISTQIVADEKE